MNGWQVPLIVVSSGFSGSERAALSRDRERGLVRPVRPGVWVRVADVRDLQHPEQRHPVRMRAFDAVCSERPIFSHCSALIAHDMSAYRRSLTRVDVLVEQAVTRTRKGVRGHRFAVSEEEVVERHGLLVTALPRTVIDVAAASPAGEGVAAADEALFRGVPRALLEQAVDLAAGRRGIGRARDAVAFAHAGAESAEESEGRRSMFLLGVEPPELQVEVWDELGMAGRLDAYHRRQRAGTEFDGAKKYLDPRLASAGAGRAVYEEKLREDRVRAQIDALGRMGWREATDPVLMRPVLRRCGVLPAEHRPTLADWAAAARDAGPAQWTRPAA